MIHKILLGIMTLFLLAGCMYPAEQRNQEQVNPDVQLEVVQHAVDLYREQYNGALPIVTKDNDTPLYQKYIIDFAELRESGFIQMIPATAFENGGTYQYVLVDVETNPTVKVLDLHLADELRGYEQRLIIYRDEHTYPPFGEKIENNIYALDHEKLHLDAPPTVTSPYSNEMLPVYITSNGDLLVDYRMDLYQVLQEEDVSYQEGEDIRSILVKNHPVVPAYSIPFTIKADEPVFAPEIEEEW
ncbi:hypothetical protein SH601_08935 [Gracilibacillus sp. S3-1-1]|uniref:Uncharacterized protein n=1 Tax=Gracilibacillus pellucidus TaxID=3095368 RepID=A0ACC6M5E2_9BACI|nr:hypothetical protein [Gracilibacillus sp. S3-1-1]MDX8046113.1 hypothetical protein [Gracilibacillus sp. S3-1-1]